MIRGTGQQDQGVVRPRGVATVEKEGFYMQKHRGLTKRKKEGKKATFSTKKKGRKRGEFEGG